jgi:hypothetical protein
VCVERVCGACVWSVWSGGALCVCGARGAWSRARTQGHNDQVGAAARRVTSANQQLLVSSFFFSATRRRFRPRSVLNFFCRLILAAGLQKAESACWSSGPFVGSRKARAERERQGARARLLPSSGRLKAVMSDEEPTSTVGMIKAMNKSSDGTNYMAESMKTFSMSEGKNKKGDVSVSTSDMGGALAAIKSMIQTAKQAAPEGSKKSNMWEFRASPHVAMGKTLDQTFISFLMWARTGFPGEEDEDEGATAGLINVSKAFRRLEAYAEWMEDSAEDLTAPLTFASVKAAVEAWQMKTSYDSHERLVWWIDLGRLDMPTIRATPVEDSFRAMVWFSHAVLFDAHAQQNGMVMCESLGRMGFYSMMTLVPMKLSAKIDRLTIGVLPVKMKLILCLDSPRWMSIMMKVRATLRARRRAPMTGCVKRACSCSRLQHLTCHFRAPPTCELSPSLRRSSVCS